VEISDDVALKSLLLEQMSHVVFAVDLDGCIVFWNSAAERILGYTREEALGERPTELLIVRDGTAFMESVRSQIRNGRSWSGEVLAQRKDGTSFYSEVTVDLVRDHTGKPVGMVCIGSDVTKRKEAESSLKQALEEKELLLKEVYHRVKNNLQVVSSLLGLQSRTVSDPKTLEILRESQNRIKSVTLIHEKLHQSQEFVRVRLPEYVKSLATYLLESYGAATSVKLIVNVENIQLDSEKAMLCGFIISELVSNSLKHAFPDRLGGEIRIDLRSSGSQEISLNVQDNGIGLSETVDIADSPSLGLKLVHALVGQLKGNLIVDRKQGTRITIIFTPEP
jgi:PAS domain S-box-containing protein